MPKIIITVGVSGSGKSTFAKELKEANPEYIEINRDSFRFDLFTNGVEDWSKYKFTKDREKEVTQKCLEFWEGCEWT